MNNNYKSLRSLKKGTKFLSYGKDDIELICVAWDKRGSSRDIKIEGREGIFSQRGDDKVQVIKN
jgi:hypothetical protein